MRQRTKIVFMTLLVINLWLLPLSAQTFEIVGRVVNGTRNNLPVANLQVELHLYQGNQENSAALRRTVTNSKGFFKFTRLVSKPDFAYMPMVRYLEVDYPGRTIYPSQIGKKDTLQIVVYDTTTSSENITVGMEHLLVDVGEGIIKMNEVLLLQNLGNKTYIGEREIAPGQRDVIQFSLPQNALHLQIGQGLMSCCLVAVKDKFYNTMPFIPGRKQVAYSYELKFGGSKFTFSKPLDYDIMAFDLFVKTPGIEVAGSNLRPVGDFRVGEVNYQRYSATDLKKHQLLEITFSNLPKGRKNLQWLVMLVVGAVLLFIVVYSLSTRTDRPKDKRLKDDKNLAAKQKLLHAIADLDDRYEKGELPTEDYQKERSRLKSKLLQLVSQIDMKAEKSKPNHE